MLFVPKPLKMLVMTQMRLIKHLLFRTVSWIDTPGIILDGGVGVGRVTKPGLPVPVGEAAINPVPRKMILTTVQQNVRRIPD